MTIEQQIFELSKKRRAKIGIGLLKINSLILDSLKRAANYVDIVVVGRKIEGFDNIIANKENIERKEIEILKSGQVEAVVRGQADAYKIDNCLINILGCDRSEILNATVMKDQFDRCFFTTSGSHNDGWTIESKIKMIDNLISLIKEFKVNPKIAALAWVRPNSLGKNFLFDQTWDQAEFLVNYYKKRGCKIKNYNIEIERAISDKCNIIVFTNGASGNIFQRAISFLTKDPFVVHFRMGLNYVFVESNRTQHNFFNNIILAAAFVNKKIIYESK